MIVWYGPLRADDSARVEAMVDKCRADVERWPGTSLLAGITDRQAIVGELLAEAVLQPELLSPHRVQRGAGTQHRREAPRSFPVFSDERRANEIARCAAELIGLSRAQLAAAMDLFDDDTPYRWFLPPVVDPWPDSPAPLAGAPR